MKKNKYKANSLISYTDLFFVVGGEMKPDNGEDSYVFSINDTHALLGVFDGCGGIGSRKYEMYGGKYHKSLCHAWGASPIYLLGRYFLGVKPVDDGYAHYVCEPNFGDLQWVKGTVPINGDIVTVTYENDTLTVSSNRDGGTLIWKGEHYPITANVPVIVK